MIRIRLSCWLIGIASLVAACSSNGESVMFNQSIESLIASNNAEEELALSQILKQARQDPSINYGYRVFNKTKNARVEPTELESQLQDELEVTIFVGEQAPYQEYKWLPKDNDLITRLIVP